MLKKIPTSELALGMYIHKFCGAWVAHPFWKGSFELKDALDIVRIQQSALTEVWVDTSKGHPPVTDGNPQHLEAPALPLSPPIPVVEPTTIPSRVSLDEELSQALKICVRAKEAVVTMFSDARLGQAIKVEDGAFLVDEITNSILRHPHALISLARLKTSDDYTYMHSVAVCILMIALARQLQMSEEQVREAGMAGLMHDVGKMMISSAILDKAGKLTPEEFKLVQSHPEEGLKILERSEDASAHVLDVCLHHHEKINGLGYPHGLAGDQISLFARMGAVCDVYDAVTSERSYKKGWGPAHSIREMASWKGHFDEIVFQNFVKTIGIYPIGALVSLQSGRMGVVIEQNEQSLLTPKVKVFLSTRSKMAIPHKVIDLACLEEPDKIVQIELAEDWGITNAEELWSGLSLAEGNLFG